MATKVTLGLALLFLNTLAASAHTNPLHIKHSHHEHTLHACQYPGLDHSKYLSPTQVMPTDMPLVTQWLKELTDHTLCASNPQAAADTMPCWWTCGGCTHDVDVVNCPTKVDWGISFNDGPSTYTPQAAKPQHHFLCPQNQCVLAP
ncbi:hypothetical protein JB92DRAFT_2825651 [Gautieria morchelliformis]|nr:hypothetical protein JB92DRAFT_2825651 [Gautieria morchelliformis]